MEAQETHELIEQSHEHAQSSKKWTALLISIFAMILAINNVGGGNSAKEAARHNIEASNYYAFYQAKSIKQNQTKLAVDSLVLQKTVSLSLTDKTKDLINQQIGFYLKDIDRYESDEKSGEGKKQLLEKAKGHEKERDRALAQDPWFDIAEGILQIAIVLLSISILASMPILTLVASVLGVAGTACMLNGFFLLF